MSDRMFLQETIETICLDCGNQFKLPKYECTPFKDKDGKIVYYGDCPDCGGSSIDIDA